MSEKGHWTSPAQLAGWVRSQASQPQDILSIAVLCEPKSPGRATCLADVTASYAPQLAGELHGQTFGFGTVVVSLAVGEDFSCPKRPAIPCNCSCRPVAG